MHNVDLKVSDESVTIQCSYVIYPFQLSLKDVKYNISIKRLTVRKIMLSHTINKIEQVIKVDHPHSSKDQLICDATLLSKRKLKFELTVKNDFLTINITKAPPAIMYGLNGKLLKIDIGSQIKRCAVYKYFFTVNVPEEVQHIIFNQY